MKTLIRVRKEIHKPTPKLTDAERRRLHEHGFSTVEIRDGIKEVLNESVQAQHAESARHSDRAGVVALVLILLAHRD
jgi:hypothetical protein